MMPLTSVAMHKIREVLRLKYAARFSQRQIASALGLSNGVVAKYVAAAERTGSGFEQLSGVEDAALARPLWGKTSLSPSKPTLVLPELQL